MNTIKILRKKQGFSQQFLAKKLSIDRSTIAKWETQKSMPRADKLPILAKIFNCTIDELYVNNNNSIQKYFKK
ncbi:helix-turn-helix domain-containing protein [Selenomonadales bacterium OttesenSCG-928-I06]|nr:helix-turn-helix domain-containing protein [Selenomonadales bacterium OttesenSCG-928-I06]